MHLSVCGQRSEVRGQIIRTLKLGSDREKNVKLAVAVDQIQGTWLELSVLLPLPHLAGNRVCG